MTPSGIEKGPDVTGQRLATGSTTEGGDGKRRAVAANCNECNEALDAARVAIVAARRLAMVADNAIVNGDVQRTRAALRDLHDAVTPRTTETERHDGASPARRR